jgi:hypothetical protein
MPISFIPAMEPEVSHFEAGSADDSLPEHFFQNYQ